MVALSAAVAPRVAPSTAAPSRRHLLAASFAPLLGIAPLGAHAEGFTAAGKVTDRVFFDVRVITRYDVEVLEDAALRGRLVFSLFGNDAPKTVQKFLEFVDGTPGQWKSSGGGPMYSSGSFTKLQPGVMLEGGTINGLRLTTFAGEQDYEWMSRLLPLRPILEANDLKHDRRGLLTRALFNPGPEFGITLGPTPALNGDNEVFGQLEPDAGGDGLHGEALLAAMEGLPYITGKSQEGEGTSANAVFQAQRSFFTTLSKTIGDTRAADRTGQLLRRVEITRCGRM